MSIAPMCLPYVYVSEEDVTFMVYWNQVAGVECLLNQYQFKISIWENYLPS